jgi:hypothetical protein
MITELLKAITGELDTHGIPYMISGSLALNVYCIPRMTMDIDIVIELDQSNMKEFLSIFSEGYYLDDETVKNEIHKRGMFNVIDHRTGLKMDFIVRKDTEYRQLEFSRRIREDIDEIPVWIVSPEDLVISKFGWIQQLQSDRQMGDIRLLLALPGIDKDYIQSWCDKLHFQTYNLI